MKRISAIWILFHLLVSGFAHAQDVGSRQYPDSTRTLAINEVTVLGRQNRTVVPVSRAMEMEFGTYG